MVTDGPIPCTVCGERLEGVARLWFGFTVVDGEIDCWVDGIADEFKIDCSHCGEVVEIPDDQVRQIGRYLRHLELMLSENRR